MARAFVPRQRTQGAQPRGWKRRDPIPPFRSHPRDREQLFSPAGRRAGMTAREARKGREIRRRNRRDHRCAHRGAPPSRSGFAGVGIRSVRVRGASRTGHSVRTATADSDHVDCAYRLDLVVDGRLLLELEAVERLLPIHEAQVVTYLRLANLPVGLLVNFNSRVLRTALRRLTLRPPNPSALPPFL